MKQRRELSKYTFFQLWHSSQLGRDDKEEKKECVANETKELPIITGIIKQKKKVHLMMKLQEKEKDREKERASLKDN